MSIVNKYHHLLKKFRNYHKGETCYIICPGQSLNYFVPQENGIFIGCNLMIKAKHIIKDHNFKYYFFGHGYNSNQTLASQSTMDFEGKYKDDIDKLGNNIQKFCFVSSNNNTNIHGKFDYNHLKNINALPVELSTTIIHAEIDKYPFYNHQAIIPCIQFALYAGFQKIYFVGADCTRFTGRDHYFFQSNINTDYISRSGHKEQTDLITKVIYYLKKNFYPNTKFININPMGLEGKLDSDIHTKLSIEKVKEWWDKNNIL